MLWEYVIEGEAQPLKDLKETQGVWSCREGGRECQKIRLEMDTGQITQGLKTGSRVWTWSWGPQGAIEEFLAFGRGMLHFALQNDHSGSIVHAESFP